MSARNMEQGFVKVAAATPKIKVADPVYNAGAKSWRRHMRREPDLLCSLSFV